MIETASSNFIFGILIGWLLLPCTGGNATVKERARGDASLFAESPEVRRRMQKPAR